MPMQKSKRSRMRRGHGRSQFFIEPQGLTFVKESGEAVATHKVSPTGWYKGKKIFKTKEEKKAARTQEA